MEGRKTFRFFFKPAAILILIGWGGLVPLLFLTRPTIWPRWIFYALWTIAWCGSAIPIMYFLNLRFRSDPPAGPNVILRQATWVGIYAATLAWIQLGHFGSIWIAIGLAGAFLAVELLIRMRERSQWRPPDVDDETSPGQTEP